MYFCASFPLAQILVTVKLSDTASKFLIILMCFSQVDNYLGTWSVGHSVIQIQYSVS